MPTKTESQVSNNLAVVVDNPNGSSNEPDKEEEAHSTELNAADGSNSALQDAAVVDKEEET